MIGGDDIVLEGRTYCWDIDVVIRTVLAVWPSGVLETDYGHWSLERASTMRWDVPHQSFIYENVAAHESWDEFGLTDGNFDQMIHVIALPDSMTFVVSERSDAKTQAIAARIVAAVDHARG